jgi:hypothetical protein
MNSGLHAYLLIKNNVNLVNSCSLMQQLLRTMTCITNLSGSEAAFISGVSVVHMKCTALHFSCTPSTKLDNDFGLIAGSSRQHFFV